MFKKLAFLFLLITLSNSLFAQKADDILGKWLNSTSECQLTIYKKGDKYFGKLSWIKNPTENGKPKTDLKNPDVKMRNNPLIGLDIVNDFTFENKKWVDGKIYDSQTGKTYSGNMTMTGLNQLNMRGYIGISLIGRTETWKRVK